jgi:hypothetical protein
MLKLNPLNERIKCDYARHLKAAQARAPPPSTPRRDRLASKMGARSGEAMIASTQAGTLAALNDFFRWLA